MSVQHFIVGENSQKEEPHHGNFGIRTMPLNSGYKGSPGYIVGTAISQLEFVYGIDRGSSTVSDSAYYQVVGGLEQATPLKKKNFFDRFKTLLKRC